MRPLTLAGLVMLASVGCGEPCPWTQLSALSITPATPCLALKLADPSGDPPSAGCNNPVVYGQNSCSDPLMVAASDSTTAMAQSFAAGEPVLIEIPLANGVLAHPGINFSVNATLGAQPITIAFHGGGGLD